MSIIGIDEVGRGALAGPVVVAAVVIPASFRPGIVKKRVSLKDSKKLTPRGREKWFEYVKGRPDFLYATARVYPRGIERLNISKAANIAATRALERLGEKAPLRLRSYKILMDGGLYLSKLPKTAPLLVRTVIKGDEKYNAIKLASIIAKVTRDRYMVKLHKSYPAYSFNLHKGYGTRVHVRAVLKNGPSEVHRLTFLKKYTKVKQRES